MKSRWGAVKGNLKGKKHKLLSCGCCSITNLKGKYFEHLAKKEMSEYLRKGMTNDPL